MFQDKWKIVSDNADTINMALLRQQQQRLAVVKAVKIFFGNQNFLRTILKQQVGDNPDPLAFLVLQKWLGIRPFLFVKEMNSSLNYNEANFIW